MKKKNLNKVFTSLLVCMLAVTAFVLKGCKNEEVTETKLPTICVGPADYVKDITGIIFSDDTGIPSWVIVSDSTIKESNNSNLEIPIVYSIHKLALSDELNEVLKSLIGKRIVFSCFYAEDVIDVPQLHDIIDSNFHYRKMLNAGFEISLYDSRSINSENFVTVCGTKSNTPPSWFFTLLASPMLR